MMIPIGLPAEQISDRSRPTGEGDTPKIDAKDDSAQRKAEEAAEEAEDGCDT